MEAHEQGINSKYIAVSLLWSTLVLIIAVVGTQAFFNWQHNLEVEKKQSAPNAELAHIRVLEAQNISELGWVNQDKQIAKIPVDLAIDRVIEQRNAGDDKTR